MVDYRAHWRRYVIVAAVLLFSAIGIYRILFPAAGQRYIIAIVLGTTTVIVLLLESTDMNTLHQIRSKRRYLTPYTALVTTLITGIMIVILTYLLASGLLVAAYIFRRSDILAQLFFEIIQQVRLFESVHPLVFSSFYISAATMITVGILVIYPLLPIQHRQVATITAFLMSWLYTLSLAYLIFPIIHALTLESMVVDALLIIAWALLFDRMYGKPLLPNPFLKKLEKNTSE